eukprot:Sdes_comp24447_c0_seq1m22366
MGSNPETTSYRQLSPPMQANPLKPHSDSDSDSSCSDVSFTHHGVEYFWTAGKGLEEIDTSEVLEPPSPSQIPCCVEENNLWHIPMPSNSARKQKKRRAKKLLNH